jgi:hypothetical protein
MPIAHGLSALELLRDMLPPYVDSQRDTSDKGTLLSWGGSGITLPG